MLGSVGLSLFNRSDFLVLSLSSNAPWELLPPRRVQQADVQRYPLLPLLLQQPKDSNKSTAMGVQEKGRERDNERENERVNGVSRIRLRSSPASLLSTRVASHLSFIHLHLLQAQLSSPSGRSYFSLYVLGPFWNSLSKRPPPLSAASLPSQRVCVAVSCISVLA